MSICSHPGLESLLGLNTYYKLNLAKELQFMEGDIRVMDEAIFIQEMESYFGKDTKRINHAKKVTGFAKQILILSKREITTD